MTDAVPQAAPGPALAYAPARPRAVRRDPPRPSPAGAAAPPAPPAGRIVLAGAASVLVFMGGLGAWSATAPLDSAAVAQGQVVVESRRKTVQHLEGGIVEDILVAEGARVPAGAPLVRLDATQARSRLETLRAQHDELLAQEARLIAERAGADRIDFPEALSARRDQERVAPLLDGQRRLFAARLGRVNGQVDILTQRKAQLDTEISGLRAQVTSADRQLGFIADETVGVRSLVQSGHERKQRLLALERETASLEGRRGELVASIARTEQARGEAELQILDLHNRRAEEVAAELRDVQARLAELGERLLSAEDVLRRTVITAPTAGVVMDVKLHTRGGVVGAGEPILDIVPDDDRLLIEAQVKPTDIDAVRVGLPARVRLTAFKPRTTPILAGEVSHVAADSLTDQRTGVSSYLVHVAVTRDALEAAGGLRLHPGMPTEVMIVTGERSALDYLLGPLEDSFARAFREE